MTDHKDNLLGVCAAIGEDFGFDPNWLRIALGVGLLFDLEKVLIAYAVAGLIVLASRLLFPNPRAATHDAPVATVPA